ncbi:MAG TPA: CDP-diacylglycerol--serine O-phosphatidyltransferase [Nitrospirota bacterium]
MRKGIYILPNLLTTCGLFFGFYSIIASLHQQFERAAWAIIIAAVFDALDGWVARMTKSTSKFGVELDSLSDLVSFGVAPALLMYIWALEPFKRLGWVGAFLFVACGAFRLARFNVQMVGSEKKWFTGLPIPGGAGFISAFVIFYIDKISPTEPPQTPWVLFMVYVLALLMISTVKFHSLKEINVRDRRPFWMLLAALGIIAAVAMFPQIVLFAIAVVYVSWALIEFILTFSKRRAKMKNMPPPQPQG